MGLFLLNKKNHLPDDDDDDGERFENKNFKNFNRQLNEY